MAIQISAFQPIGATVINVVGGAAGATTMTFNSTVLGMPSARIVNAGTANAFIQFVNSGNTTTVGVTNSVPILATSAVVLATGGLPCLAFNAASTFTTTIFVTGGQGGAAS